MRYIVVGTSGAGKSTFAQSLAKATDSPYVELDELYWGNNWTAVPASQFASRVMDATAGESWVADGNYSAVREALWARATHVIWLNHSRATVFSRILRRTIGRGLLRTRLSHGNRESLRMAFFSRDSILLWSYSTYAKNQLKFTQLREHAQFSHLVWSEFRSPSQARAYLARINRER